MIIDGNLIARRIASQLKAQLEECSRVPKLAVITCAPNFETQKFLGIKMRKAKEVGIDVAVVELPDNITTEGACTTITKAAESADGIVVQLPFPKQVDRNELIVSIPLTHDVDAFNTRDSDVLPPVVGAIREILDSETIDPKGKQVVVIGSGQLVGKPTAIWFEEQGAKVSVITQREKNWGDKVKDADIVVLGTGVPGLLKPDMVKEGVIILDAGTSEDGGELKGDAHPDCSKKASLFTPVPGGIGPITVAVLLRNLVLLQRSKR